MIHLVGIELTLLLINGDAGGFRSSYREGDAILIVVDDFGVEHDLFILTTVVLIDLGRHEYELKLVSCTQDIFKTQVDCHVLTRTLHFVALISIFCHRTGYTNHHRLAICSANRVAIGIQFCTFAVVVELCQVHRGTIAVSGVTRGQRVDRRSSGRTELNLFYPNVRGIEVIVFEFEYITVGSAIGSKPCQRGVEIGILLR